ncbi:restriction endonuclease subunit S [Psychrobacter sp. Pi2-52]|uniref:restriction endonuclease subunit S n=1 Tax=Psychrobacter sp. Pi2-52 TaxID=2774133 RepID=UPI001918503B|nr:restriction endonuclease subunit S [Psychrobacter sp. Pi2-52]
MNLKTSLEMGKDISKPEQLITEHIDIWTSAIRAKSTSGRGSSKKYELYGISKLRELIFDLAVRGKLVPQNPDDEPASVLVKKMLTKKEKSIEEGTIKKGKPLPDILTNQMNFDTPTGWEWCILGEVCHVERGGSPRPIKSYLTESDDGLNWIKISDTDQGGKYINQTVEKIRPEGLKKTRMVYPGDFLLTNSMSFGRPYITNIEGCIHDGWLRINPPNEINKNFLYLLLSSPYVYKIFKESASGAVVQNLNSEKVRGLVFALPPFDEQAVIAAKVDELMLLCDQLEQQTEASIEAHATLVEVLLATLTDSVDANELAQNWARISEYFDSLFTTEQSIEALKQTVLQLAVMGKLVSQNSDDEPASVLLEKIAEEKEQLIQEKKIKPRKALPPIEDEERLFDLPLGWEWCRLDDICDGITSGSTPPKSSFIDDTGIPYLKVYNIRNQKIDFEYQPQFIEEGYHSSSLKRSQLCPGDVIMNIVGPPLGKIAIIPDTYPEWNCNQAIVMFRPFISNLNKFIYTYLVSGMFLDKIALIGTAGQDNISVTKSRSILLPTPPLAEQLRIVAKIDELMAICDQLKEKLQQSQETQVQLTDALVDRALG